MVVRYHAGFVRSVREGPFCAGEARDTFRHEGSTQKRCSRQDNLPAEPSVRGRYDLWKDVTYLTSISQRRGGGWRRSGSGLRALRSGWRRRDRCGARIEALYDILPPCAFLGIRLSFENLAELEVLSARASL